MYLLHKETHLSPLATQGLLATDKVVFKTSWVKLKQTPLYPVSGNKKGEINI